MTWQIVEITNAAPAVLRFEVRDADVTEQGVIAATGADIGAGASSTWTLRTGYGTPETNYCFIIGANKTHMRFEDRPPLTYFNISAALVAGNWTCDNSRTVTAVYRKTVPYLQGESRDDGTLGNNHIKVVSMRHYIYVVFSSALVEGTTYRINPPAACDLGNVILQFDLTKIRSCSVHTSHIGYALNEASKYAYLSHWIPGYGTEGRCDFSALTTFNIIDVNGTVVFTGTPSTRIGPTTTETGSSIQPDDARLTSTTQPVRTVVTPGYDKANPCKVYFTGNDLANDMIIRIESLRATESTIDAVSYLCIPDGAIEAARNLKVKNVNNGTSPKSFTVQRQTSVGVYADWDSTAWAQTWRSGGLIKETTTSNNRAATHVYGCDFTAFVPSSPGVYRLSVPNLGVSHPFRIDNAVWHHVAKQGAGAEDAHRHGVACDGTFGYTRPAGFDPTTQSIYQCLVPLVFSNEVGYSAPDTNLSVQSIFGRFGTVFMLNTTVAFAPGHHDAGDHDSRLLSHYGSYLFWGQLYRRFPAAMETTNWGVRKILAIYPSLSARYAGTNVLPDILHQLIWVVQSYLDAVDPVTGQSCGGVNNTPDSSTTPSWLKRSGVNTSNIYAYAPDNFCTFALSSLCAVVANCLGVWNTRNPGSAFTTLKSFFETQATTLYATGNLTYDNSTDWGSHSSGAVDTARVALYGAYKNAIEELRALPYDAGTAYFGGSTLLVGETITAANGATAVISHQTITSGAPGTFNLVGTLYVYDIVGTFIDNNVITSATGAATTNIPSGVTQPFPTTFNTIFNVRNDRLEVNGTRGNAACEIYAFNGDIAYSNVATTSANFSGVSIADVHVNNSYLTYSQLTHANRDTAKQAAYITSINAAADQTIAAHATVGIKMMMGNGASGKYGTNGTDIRNNFPSLFASYVVREATTPGSGAACRAAIADGMTYILGSNQVGRSFMTGFGYDPIREMLHNDSMAAGVRPPTGIVVYGPGTRNFDRSFFGQSLETGAWAQWCLFDHPASYTANGAGQKSIEPSLNSWPRYELFFEAPGAIELTEYVSDGCVFMPQTAAAFLWATASSQPTSFTAVSQPFKVRTQ